MKEKLETRTVCRICGKAPLTEFLDLGVSPLADAFVEKKALVDTLEPRFPLAVAVCSDCNLVQMTSIVDSHLLFSTDYAFYTSGSPHAVRHFRKYAQDVMAQFPELGKKLTVEIASNDGALLRPFKELGATVLGVDPARNVAPVAQGAGIETVIDFFTKSLAEKIVKERGQAGLVIANNVVAHVDDLHDFMQGVKSLLSPEGVFIFEVQYFPNLLFRNQFDNVYHEHRSFFALRPLVHLLAKNGLRIFNVVEVDTQGGSIRVFASHANSKHQEEPVVSQMLQDEIELGLGRIETYQGLHSRVQYIKKELLKILHDLKRQGKRVVGYGAPAKGNTLLNFCGIGPDLVEYIVDKTYFKHGKFTPGMHIPVFPIEKLLEDGPPDYYLLLVWNYAPAILRDEEEYRKKGGKFIIPIPYPQIV